MTKAGGAGRGVFMTNGTINVVLLDYEGGKIPDMNNDKPLIGTIHFGMWVDDLAAGGWRGAVKEVKPAD